jgi:hypothetical protein
VVLSGALSNPQFKDLVQCLTSRKRRKVPAEGPKPFVGWPDGRRRFGSVSTAIVNVLSRTDAELPVHAIHAAVEALLGDTVSTHSVADYLIKRSKGSRPLFERTRYGHYRLLHGR